MMRHPSQRAAARYKAEQGMTETVLAGEFKRTTGANARPVRTLVKQRYDGKAEVKYPSLVVSDTNTSGQIVAAQSVVVKLPVDAPILAEGDEIQVTASAADGGLVGKFFRVDGAPQGGQVTAHRYPVTELT